MSSSSSNSSTLFWIPTETDELFVKAELVNDESVLANKLPENTNKWKKCNDSEQQITLKKLSDNQTVKISINEIWPVNPNIFDKVNDMSELTHLNEPSVLQNLQNRYMDDLIYTYSGLFLVAVNPYKQLHIYDMQYIELYHNKNTLENSRPSSSDSTSTNEKNNGLPPHVYNITENAFQHLLENKQNQSILVTGESGAGKTENTKKILQYLTSITEDNSIKSSHKFEEKILNSNPILESFGNSQTVRNNNSSRFGKFIKIQISNVHQKIIGAEIEWYLLEKSRIISQAKDERNFHIFYELLTGLKDTKYDYLKNDLLIDSTDYESYNILNNIKAQNDSNNFQNLITAFDTIGFSKDDVQCIFRIVSAILHIGNLEYSNAMSNKTDKQAEFSNPELLAKISTLLGISNKEDFEQSLLKPKSKAGREWVAKSKNVQQSKGILHALSKNLYTNLFNYIVHKINSNLNLNSQVNSQEDTDMHDTINYIGLLDIAGFEIFQRNSFEQFCINYTNEKLQQFFNQHMFILEQKEYLNENIEWDYINFGKESKATIDLIEVKNSNPTGILPLLDEESIIPNSNDESFYNKLINNWGDNKNQESRFKRSKKQASFILRHYAGDVEYDTEGWLSKNRDPLNDHLLRVLSDSSIPLVSQFFESDDFNNNSIKVTTSSRHRDQLKSLLDQLQSTNPHFVRCIIPNNLKLPSTFDRKLILDQLRCNGVLEGIRIAREGYPNRIPFKEFYQRYHFLLDKKLLNSLELSNYKKNCEILISTIMKILPTLYKVGTTKLFFKAGVLASLEDMIEEKLMKVSISLNPKVKGALKRRFIKHKMEEINASREIGNALETYNKKMCSNPWFKLYIKLKPLLNSSEDIIKNRKIQDNLKKMQKTITDTEEKCTILTSELNKKDNELTNMRGLLSDESKKLELQTKLLECSKANEQSLNNDIAKLTTLNKTIEEAKILLSRDNEKYKDKIEKLESSFMEVEQTHTDRFESEKSKLISELGDLKSNVREKEQSIAALATAKNELTIKLNKMNELDRQQKEQIEDMKQQLSNSESNLDSKLITLEKSCNSALTRLKKLVDENSKLHSQISTLNTANDFSQKQLKLRTSEIKELKLNLDSNQKELEKLTNERNSELAAHNILVNDFKEIKNKLAMSVEAYKQLEITHNKLKNEQSKAQEHDEQKILELKSRLNKEVNLNQILTEKLSNMNTGLQIENNLSQTIINDNERKYEELSSTVHDLRFKLTESTDALEKVIESEKDLVSKLRFSETKLASSMLENKNAKSELNILKAILRKYNPDINIENHLSASSSSIDSVVCDSSLELQHLRKQLEIETRGRFDAERIIEKLNKKIEILQQGNSPPDFFKLKFEASEQKVKALEQKLRITQPLRDRTNINLSAGDIFTSRENLSKYEDEVRFYKLENYKLQEFLNDADKKINTLVHSLKQSNSKNTVLSEHLARMEIDLKNTETHNEVLNSNLKQQKIEFEKCLDNLDRNSEKVNEYTQLLIQAESDIKEMTQVIDKLKSSDKEKTKLLWEADLEKTEITSKLQDTSIELQKREKQISLLESNLGHYKTQLNKLENSKDNTVELENLKEKVIQFSKLEMEYKKEIANLKYNNETLHNDSEASVAQLMMENSHYGNKLEQMILEKDSAIAEAQEVGKLNEDLLEKNKNISMELSEMHDANNILSNKIQNITNELTIMKSELHRIVKENTDLLNNKSYLEETLALQKEQIERNSKLLKNLQNELNDSKIIIDTEKQKIIDLLEENQSIDNSNKELVTNIKALELRLSDNSEKDDWQRKLTELQELLTSETDSKFEEMKKCRVLEAKIDELQRLNERQTEMINVANEDRKTMESNSIDYVEKLNGAEKQLMKQQLDMNRMIRDNAYFEDKVEELNVELNYWRKKYESAFSSNQDVNVSSKELMV